MAKMTAEQKARNAQVKAETDARMAEAAARASLDSCEGATETERDRLVRYAAWRVQEDLEDTKSAYLKATKSFAERAARMAEEAQVGTSVFYDGGWFARESVNLEVLVTKYKAAAAAAQTFENLFPGVKPIW